MMGSCIYCGVPMRFFGGWMGWVCRSCYLERKESLLRHYREVKIRRQAEREAAERNPVHRCSKCGRGIPAGRKTICQQCINARQRELTNLWEAEAAKAPDPELDAVAKRFNRKYPDRWLAEYLIGGMREERSGE